MQFRISSSGTRPSSIAGVSRSTFARPSRALSQDTDLGSINGVPRTQGHNCVCKSRGGRQRSVSRHPSSKLLGFCTTRNIPATTIEINLVL